MFGKLGEMASLVQKAKDVQKNIQKIREELAASEFEGTAASGAVKVYASGDFQLKRVEIAPDILEKGSDLAGDLVVIAANEALVSAKGALQRKIAEATGGMDVPGII